ncbi:methyl-CpG-binding domain-containing protein [Sarracenia purpurea var. burkii]
MASATVDSHSDRLQLDSIATVDLRLLSQSELYALSLCSDGAFDARRCDDVVIPKIDRSVFNESAGSRKQTYSRLRLAPRKPDSSAAAAATTTATAIPRCAPHLRTPKSASNTIDDTDPEGTENSQIIGLLKELFSAETNGDNLIPIRVEYSDSVPHFPNMGINVTKRKRGRPRKNENLALVAVEATEVMPPEALVEGCDDVFEDIVVRENVDERDKEIVNKNGIVVNLAALASMEDPYGPELQRRTVDLLTEEGLLGFLGQLDGQWGSRRRKKKIVDASEFGDALPKGWKILLSLKKKEGRVWLFVRRYISPNGRQFVSCKEVSSYLFSFGLQDVNLPNCDPNSENTHLPCNVVSANSADLAAKEISKSGELVSYSPSFIPYASNDHVKKQVTTVVGNSVEVQRREILNCNKCPMTFNVKDDLLLHQLSLHRRKRSRFGASITDGVIINGGQYECQFCHKTFNERNRYNGHVGAHKRHHMKSDEASAGGILSMQNSAGPVSSGGAITKESMMQNDCTAVIFNAKPDNDQNPVSPDSKFKAGTDIENYPDGSSNEAIFLPRDEQDSQFNKNERNFAEESCDEAIFLRRDGQDSHFNKNERNFAEESCVKHDENYKMNNHLQMVDETTAIVAKINFCLNSEALSGIETNSNGESNIIQSFASRVDDCPVGQGKRVESCLRSPIHNEKISGTEIDVDDSVSVVEPNQEAGPDSVLLAPKHNKKTCGTENVEDVHFTSPMEQFKLDAEKSDTKLILGFCSREGPDEVVFSEGKEPNGSGGSSFVHDHNDKKCNDFNIVNVASTSSLAGSQPLRGSESIDEETFGVKDEDSVIRAERENSDNSLLHLSWKEQLCDIEDNGGEGSAYTMDGREGSAYTMAELVSGYEQTCGVKIDNDNISTTKMEEPKLDEEVQTYGHNELAFDTSQGRPNRQEISHGFCSFDLSGNEQTRNVAEIVTGFCNSADEPPSKQESSFDTGLLTHASIGKTFGDVYDMTSLFTRSIEESQPNEVRNSSNSDLIIDFGNNDTRRIVADVMNNVPIEQTYGFETNLSTENNSRFWEGPAIDEIGSSGHDKLTIFFGSADAQSDGDVMPGSMWRTGGENTLPSTLADISNQPEHSSSCFPTFGIVSDKDEHELLSINRKYDGMPGFEVTQSAHTAHVEYSFLTTQNLNPLPVNSKALSYDTEMGQGFDSSFWLEKDALSLNIGTTNLVTAVCVWCRNEFHREPVHSGTQTDTIGSMCPNCSAKVSDQFNFF